MPLNMLSRLSTTEYTSKKLRPISFILELDFKISNKAFAANDSPSLMLTAVNLVCDKSQFTEWICSKLTVPYFNFSF